MSQSNNMLPTAGGARLAALLLLGCAAQVGAAAEGTAAAAPAGITATQIAERNVAARGGANAWRAVQTLAESGKLEAGRTDSVKRSERLAHAGLGAAARHQTAAATVAAAGTPDPQAQGTQVQLPFRLELKRPDKSRVEVDFAGVTAIQVFDGKSGWKIRPFLNRTDVEPFTAAEAKATTPPDLGGPLMDYVARGATLVLVGSDSVDGHPAYKLKLTGRDGRVQQVWVDKQSFLDVKVEGIPRHMDGRMRNVYVTQRDFKSVQGLMVPYEYETQIDGSTQTHKMTIESVAVNKPLDETRFAKPQLLAANPAPVPAAAK